jgi:hypothetical protein
VFNQILLWSALVVPWFSLILMKPALLKRYAPVVLLSALLVTINQEVAYSLNWWVNQDQIVPWGHITNISLVYGMFAVGTYWIFYFSYGSFWFYLVLNAVIDGVWLILTPPYMESRGILLLVNMNAWLLFVISMGISVILYGFQMWQEGIYKEEVSSRSNNEVLKKWLERLGGKREPAR